MDLTSVRRVKYALGVESTAQDHTIAGLVGAASSQICQWLRRKDQGNADAVGLREREETFNPAPGQRIFYPRAYPIASISAIETDAYGRYDGDEVTVDADSYTFDARSIIFTALPSLPEWPSFPLVPKGLRVTYTAGLAASPVVSSWTTSTDAGGTMAVGQYIQGQDSLAVGRITARGATTLSYECLAGTFQEDETVTEYARWKFGAQEAGPVEPTGVTATLTACTAQSLAESHPALVQACEMHIEFLLNNRSKFDNLTVTENGATKTSRADLKNRYDFLPEIVSMLEPYANRLVVA